MWSRLASCPCCAVHVNTTVGFPDWWWLFVLLAVVLVALFIILVVKVFRWRRTESESRAENLHKQQVTTKAAVFQPLFYFGVLQTTKLWWTTTLWVEKLFLTLIVQLRSNKRKCWVEMYKNLNIMTLYLSKLPPNRCLLSHHRASCDKNCVKSWFLYTIKGQRSDQNQNKQLLNSFSHKMTFITGSDRIWNFVKMEEASKSDLSSHYVVLFV